MPILVTGSTGFLGTNLVEHLCALGKTHLRCFVRPNSDTHKLDALRTKYPSTNLEYLAGNLLCSNDVDRAVRGVDTIYHLAAQLRGAAPSLFENTVVASRNLLEGIIAHGIRRVVLVSSISVYGLAQVRHGASITESQPLDSNPERRDSYTFSKIRQDLLFQQYRRQYNFELVILRTGPIYGSNRPPLPGRAGLRFGSVFLQIAPHHTIPVVYIDNCVAALALAGSREFREGCYNVVDDDLPTGQEYVHAFRSAVQHLHCMKLSAQSALLLARILDRYRQYSKDRIPRLLTPYQVKAAWGGHRFSNLKLKQAGWRPPVPTAEAMLCTFGVSSPLPKPAKGTESSRTYLPNHPSQLVKSEN
jgi:nucleoside-diphosphate-sugar epimerase